MNQSRRASRRPSWMAESAASRRHAGEVAMDGDDSVLSVWLSLVAVTSTEVAVSRLFHFGEVWR